MFTGKVFALLVIGSVCTVFGHPGYYNLGGIYWLKENGEQVNLMPHLQRIRRGVGSGSYSSSSASAHASSSASSGGNAHASTGSNSGSGGGGGSGYGGAYNPGIIDPGFAFPTGFPFNFGPGSFGGFEGGATSHSAASSSSGDGGGHSGHPGAGYKGFSGSAGGGHQGNQGPVLFSRFGEDEGTGVHVSGAAQGERGAFSSSSASIDGNGKIKYSVKSGKY